MSQLLLDFGLLIVPTVYMICFGLLGYSLMHGLQDASNTYQSVYAEQASRELESLFLFIDARRIAELARITAVIVFITFFLMAGDFSTPAGMFRGVFVGAICAGLVLMLPSRVILLLRKRRLERFNLQLTDALGSMSSALRVGFSIQQSFETIVEEGDDPISQEFAVFLQQCRVGVHFEDALVNLEERVGSEDLTLMVRAIEIARQTGGNLTEVFDQIAMTIEERTRIEGKIKSLTAMGRLQGIVVGLIPIFLLVVMTLLDPKMMMAFYSSPMGIGTLVAVLIMVSLGFVIIRKIMKIEV